MVSSLDILSHLNGQISRLSSSDLTMLVHGIGEIVETSGPALTPQKISTLDSIMSTAGRHIEPSALPQFTTLALNLRTDMVAFVATLIERSDPICAMLASKGHQPLTALDLIRAASTGAVPVLPGIAVRRDLDGTCVEVLINRNDITTTRVVARNLFAPLIASCQRLLAELARTDEIIRMSMFCRPRLENDVGTALLAMAREGDFTDPGTSMQRYPLTATFRRDAELLLELYHRTRKNVVDPLSRQELSELGKLQRITLDEQLIMMLASGHFIDVSDFLADELRISTSRMIAAFSRGDDYEIAAICYHLDLSPAVFAALAQESDRRHKRFTRPLNKLVMQYTTLNKARFKAMILGLGTRVPARVTDRAVS